MLLISDDAADARLIREALAEPTHSEWRLQRAKRLSDGVNRLRKGGIVAVLLDLFLPDSQGIKTFETLFEAAPLVPILVLTDGKNEAIAWHATQCGAQDHLLKNHLDGYWLPRILHSVIQRKAAEEALFIEKERAQVTLNSIGDAVLSTDIAGNITYLNSVAEGMTGWSCQEAMGRPLVEVFRIVDGATRELAPDPMAKAVQHNQTVGLTANCILIRRDGFESAIEDSAAPIHDRHGQVTGAVIVFRDVSAARAVRQKMAHLAHHDFLTDLPNRGLLSDRIANAIALARRHGKQRAVLFLDLDRFKQINDSLGHPTGDELLQSVAQRLRACVRGADTVSRQGGDEFVVLLSEIEHAEDAGSQCGKDSAGVGGTTRYRREAAPCHGQYWHQHLSRRRPGCGDLDQVCGHRDVPRKRQGAEQLPVLQPGHERPCRRTPVPRRQPAPRPRMTAVLHYRLLYTSAPLEKCRTNPDIS